MSDGDQLFVEGQEPSRAFEEARQRRVELHEALVHLELSISSPARGRVADWAADVTKALLHLQAAFDEHVLVTERPGGLYDEVLEKSPRLAGQVRRLRDEHPVIGDAIKEDLERLGEPVGAEPPDASDAPDEADPRDSPLDDVRDDLQRLMGLVVRHRQRGADLVWEVYNLDIGGAE
jgi:hypothetical protein